MSSKRTQILMAVLLLLVFGYIVYPSATRYLWSQEFTAQKAAPPLPGSNAITGLDVKKDANGLWMADFDYFYTGAPVAVSLRLDVDTTASTASRPRVTTYVPRLERGQHHVHIALSHPGHSVTRTKVVIAAFFDSRNNELVSQRLDRPLDWPTLAEWASLRYSGTSSPDQLLQRAVALIDTGREEGLVDAKTILERLIDKDPRLTQAYVELARVAMKTNWGPEGLHQAESLLSSALQISPDSANAKILMGYVYANQQRYGQAEAMFVDAARSNPPNLWLWANWGELLAMQGKSEQAIEKYRELIAHPRSEESHDRARQEGFRNLVKLYGKRKDLDNVEAMMKQRHDEYGPGGCFTPEYARFMLQQRGDVPAAIQLAAEVVGTTCSREAEARQILGMAYYMVWTDSAAQPAQAEALNKARVYLPAGPMPLYLLAGSEKTLPAAKKLIAAGEKIDQKDNQQLNALAYALQNDDLAAAKRLLNLGARPDAVVGYDMPVALMPVMSGNLDGVRLMQQFGADYAKLRFQGSTAFDAAKGSGDNELLAVLQQKAPIL